MTSVDWNDSFEEISDSPKPQAPPAFTTSTDANWPKPEETAYYGLAGEVVARILPHTESDPVALLLQYLVSFGNAIGRKPHYLVEGTQHFANLFGLLVGETSESRKGTAADRIRPIFVIADPVWALERNAGGMSSGEGLVYPVRDPVIKVNKQGEDEVVDPGVEDKRLMVDEREFFQALTVLKREGNTLSRVVRDAWDCRETIGSLTKHSPTRATKAFISIMGHITPHELRQTLDQTSMANGYANRILFACVRRSKLLPHGGALDENTIGLLGAKTLEAIIVARGIGRVTMTPAAVEHWIGIYGELAKGAPGLLGAITGRAAAQNIRLALIYALLDQAPQIDIVHLDAALALWRFCKASAHHIFGDTLGDPAADTILRALKSAGTNGLMRNDIINLFGRNLPTNKLDAALLNLQKNGKAHPVSRKKPTGGRAIEVWFAT